MSEVAQLLIFHIDQHRCAIRLQQIDCVLRAVAATPLPQGPGVVIGVFDLRGKIIPLFSMRKRLGISQPDINPSDLFVIGHTSAGRVVGLLADGIAGIMELPANNIVPGDAFRGDPGQVEGAIQLSDGLILIHNLDHFLAADEEPMLCAALNEYQSDAIQQ